MSYNSGSNRVGNFTSAEWVAQGRFEIMSTITPELYNMKFNYLLIASITKFLIKKVYMNSFVLKTSKIVFISLKVGGKQH